MLSQTKHSTPLILTKFHRDILLYLCDFLDIVSILNFSLTCKKSYQLINENELYWRLRYYREFALDEDWREEAWLSRYGGQTTSKRPTSTSQSKTLEQKATCDWSHINWYKAYYRRHMIDKHIVNCSWYESYCDLPVDPGAVLLCIKDMSAWATLIGENGGTRMWIVRHDIPSLELESKQLVWNELTLPEDTIGKVVTIYDTNISNSYVIVRCLIHVPEESSDYDQSSSVEIHERGAIIAWDIRDVSRVIPIYIQQYDEARSNVFLPELICNYDDWVLCSTKFVSGSQLNDASHRYFVYDLKRKSYHPFGPIYTPSHVYFQATTKNYAQVITLHFNSTDMEVRHENPAMEDDRPTELRLHWHSYIFDDEHNTSLEDHSGEIIVPYCDNPTIDCQKYGPGLAMITIYDAKDPLVHIGGSQQHAMLALVRVPNHSLPQNGISRRRRARYNVAVGKVVWIQPIATKYAHPLYSQNLIVVQQDSKFDILSGTDGKIVHQLDCDIYNIFEPIIGPYCYLLDCNNNGFIVNVETGETFQHSSKLRPPKKRCSAASSGGVYVTGDNDTTEDVGVFDEPMTEDTNLMEEAHSLGDAISVIVATDEVDEADDVGKSFASDDVSYVEAALKVFLFDYWNVESSFTPCCWPFCNCIGKIDILEPVHRNRFYLYSLSGF
jgi:hypothetical protein